MTTRADAPDADAGPNAAKAEGAPGPTAFDVAGPLDAPAIVFIHGTRLTRKAWVVQMTALSDEFRTIAIDLPGHGVLADVPFTLAGASDRLAKVIDDEAGGQAIVVGLSLGGFVAIDFAARSPERVRGLVLAGATVEPTGPRRLAFLAFAWGVSSFERPRLAALNRWLYRRRFAPDIAEPIIAGGFYSRSGAVALRSIVGQSFLPRLAAYPGRTLILEGARDLPLRLMERTFLRSAQHGKLVRIAGATHLSNLDRPAAFNDAVRRFARSLESTG